MISLEGDGECINVEEGLSLEGEIVGYSSVSLSLTLCRNEKIEQHIRKKIRKLNALRFWVEGGVIPLYVGLILILCEISRFCPLRLPNIYYFLNIFVLSFCTLILLLLIFII